MKLNRRNFIKGLGFAAGGASLVGSVPGAWAHGLFGSSNLERATPESQGVSSTAILALLDEIAKSEHEFHSLMILRHGHAVAEGWWSPYAPKITHTLYSMSKSFTSTAVGFAVAEGKLSVDDRVVSFFPDKVPATVSENLAALRIRDLLSMTVGHQIDSTGIITKESDWVRCFLAQPVVYKPGSVFLYNSGATYMCSAIVQKVTGQKIIDYLTPRLFKPLGIKGITWNTCPRGINTGGWGLNVQTEALAKFGQLYLQKGLWEGERLLPARWIEEATTAKIMQPGNDQERQNSDWHQGYCYQFWRCRHNAVRGDGAFGQYTIIMPDQDAVVAITGESPSMQKQINLVWDHILPAMQSAPLPEDNAAQAHLKKRLLSLSIEPPAVQPSSPLVSHISGQTFQMEVNNLHAREVSFRFDENTCVFSIKNENGEYPITCGIQKWLPGETDMPFTPTMLIQGGELKNTKKSKVVASATWVDPKTLKMTWRFYETPHHDTVTCKFEGNQLTMDFVPSFTGKPKFPALHGILV